MSVAPKNVAHCNCVAYARAKSGINVGSIGLAINHPINADKAQIGALVVTREGYWVKVNGIARWTGHLGVVKLFTATHILITDANYLTCRVTERWLPIDSKLIKGYFIKNVVL